MITNWIELPAHRLWLARHFQHLLEFGRRTPHPSGGAAWLTDAGVPWLDQGVQTWITCRTVHVYCLGALAGRPGSRPVAAAALAGLTGVLHDTESGGWFSAVAPDGSTPDEKAAYTHAFVVLAASSATAAGLEGAAELLAEALAVFEERFWDEASGRSVDTWNRDFTVLDPYRGINANMHTVEAFLAAADVTGDRVWLDRASRVAAFAVAQAEANEWRLPEHYDSDWTPQLELNVDRPDDKFKPYGATIGHGLEWARLLLHLEAAGATGVEWLPAAAALFDRAIADGWHADGADGFVYTTDWSGRPVVRDRMHWVTAEAIGASAALFRRTGNHTYSAHYARYWDYAERFVLDHENGSWHHQLDPQNRPADSVWPGKADLYHAAQATLIPTLPLAPSLATALARGLHA
ncbi:MAG TPA: AGE family epimerase/isomerase [Propionicimonas sp.]|nr:AGE family epimerase/isomerase [Propionicimonas sp.]HQA78145.1 AGE family epimerase/isomerase [Propionicimonas sp.]HQD97971.1 AGE family epimerase/isomerase [Propionicimonas sp.]